jgi:hypothetical protein
MSEVTRERARLDRWTAENPKDHVALLLFAAWVNCPVDKLPATMRGHTCPETMKAWGRVAEAAMLETTRIEALTAENAALALQVQRARDDALEEAAQICWTDDDESDYRYWGADANAHAVRVNLMGKQRTIRALRRATEGAGG